MADWHDREGMRVGLEAIADLTKKGLIGDMGLHFQCPPLDELSGNFAHSHTDYETIETQHSRKGVPQLATVQFTTLVVDYGTFVVNANVDPEAIRESIKQICLSGTPVQLTCEQQIPATSDVTLTLDQISPEIDMAATLRTVKISNKAGEPDARYYDVSFVEYRDPRASRRGLGKPKSRRPRNTTVYLYWDGRAETSEGQSIKPPVTLSSLGRGFFADPSKGRWIAAANGLKSWGLNDPLINAPRFKHLKKGQHGKLIISLPSSSEPLVAELSDKVVEAVPGW